MKTASTETIWKNISFLLVLSQSHLTQEYMAKAPAYITLKDLKDNFRSAHPCRLINPRKSEIGKISKSIFENINRNLLKLLQVNQWRNSESVIKWFYSIENKSQCKFIQLDIAEFYLSI